MRVLLMLRPYLPGLGLSAAVVLAALGVYSILHGDPGPGRAGHVPDGAAALEVRLPALAATAAPPAAVRHPRVRHRAAHKARRRSVTRRATPPPARSRRVAAPRVRVRRLVRSPSTPRAGTRPVRPPKPKPTPKPKPAAPQPVVAVPVSVPQTPAAPAGRHDGDGRSGAGEHSGHDGHAGHDGGQGQGDGQHGGDENGDGDHGGGQGHDDGRGDSGGHDGEG